MTSYLMDSPKEAQRLIDKVDAKAWVGKYIKPHLVAAGAFLDVGCGPGHILAEVMALALEIGLYGVDISESRLELAARAVAGCTTGTLFQANAVQLPLPRNTVDCAFTRFLLEFVSDTQCAVNEIVRVTKPSGTVILQDLDGQFLTYWPADEMVDQDIARVLDVTARTGFDPNVGRKLFTLAKRAGLQNIRVLLEPYHCYSGAPNDTDLQLWKRKFNILIENASKLEGLTADELRCSADRFITCLQRAEGFYYSILVTVTGTKAHPV